MTRDEFKNGLSSLVDELIDKDRELSEADEQVLQDNFGDVATDVLDNEDTDASGE